MEFAYHATGGQGFDEAYLEPGDSGGPSFEVVKGSLAVVGMHFYNSYPPAIYDGAVSGDSFAPFYISQLDANMSGGQQVSAIPEPACLSLLVGRSGDAQTAEVDGTSFTEHADFPERIAVGLRGECQSSAPSGRQPGRE